MDRPVHLTMRMRRILGDTVYYVLMFFLCAVMLFPLV